MGPPTCKGILEFIKTKRSVAQPNSGFIDQLNDYARVLQLINEFLPVKELAGRLIEVPVLRQFGLVENEQVDSFLARAFRKSERALTPR